MEQPLPPVDELTSDTALLRRIALNTDLARFYLGWLLAIAAMGVLSGLIIGIILAVDSQATMCTGPYC